MMKVTSRILPFFLVISVGFSSCTKESRTSANEDQAHDHVEVPSRGEKEKKRWSHPELPKSDLYDRASLEAEKRGGYKFLKAMDSIVWTDLEKVVNLRFSDPVMSFFINDRQYVIPWYAIKNSHVGNLTIDGVDVIVVICEVCSGSSIYRSHLDGNKKYFNLAGIYNGSNCLIDEDNEVWGSFSGEALTGPNKGKRLERIHSFQTTWKDWLKVNNQALVADYPDSYRKGHHEDAIIGDDEKRPGMMRTMEREIDPRLPMNEMVQGVSLGDMNRAYQHSKLEERIVVNDTLGGQPLVVMSMGGTSMITVFSRVINGRTLSFTFDNEVFVDIETGSKWTIQGTCIDGELKGEKLEYINNHHEEWYAWAASYPQTTIYTGNN